MKYIFLVLIFIGSSVSYAGADIKKLRLLTWGGLISPDVISSFEKETGIKLEVSVYHNIEMRNDLLKNKFLRSYDVVITSLSGIQEFISNDMLDEIEFNRFSNYQYMKHDLLSSFNYSEHSIVLNYTSLGLVYRKDKISNPPKSWKDFIEKSSTDYSGKISYPNSQYDAFNVIYFAEYASINDINIDKLFHSANVLDSLTEHIGEYSYPSSGENDSIMNGNIWIGATYNYDAKEMIAKNSNIGFYYPEEGTRMWSDAIAVLKHSTMKVSAYQFIDHLMSEKSAYANFIFNGYSSVNKLSKYLSIINENDNKDNIYLLPLDNVKKHAIHKYDNFISDKEFYFFRHLYDKHSKKGVN